MPVEIRELIIKANISSSDLNRSDRSTGNDAEDMFLEKEELVKTCVDQVLEILKDREER